MWNAQYNPGNPYGEMLQGMQIPDGSAAQMRGQQQLQELMRRQQEEDERQKQSMNSGSQDMLDQFMQGSSAAPTSTLPASAMGGGTLQASMSAPLAQAAPLASQTGIGGGAVVGPMSQAPVAGMSMAPGGTAGATMGGVTSTAVPTAAGTTATGATVGTGGAGAGSAAAGGGMAALGAASMIGLPIAAGLGAAQWTNNTHDDVNWGTHFTDPNKAHGALGENMDVMGERWFGNNTFGKGMGAAGSSPGKIIAPSSPGEWAEGVGDLLFINQTAEGLGQLWRGLADLF